MVVLSSERVGVQEQVHWTWNIELTVKAPLGGILWAGRAFHLPVKTGLVDA